MRSGRQPLAAIVVLLLAGGAQARAISGVCPDGSIFIVQRADAIPCRDAKRVDPGDIPPLNPEFLPRPYGWDVFNRETDPNNPYNMIESARPAPAPRSGRPAQTIAPPRPEAAPQTKFAPGPSTARGFAPTGRTEQPTPHAALSFALAPHELDDLVAIVSVLQDHAPATLVQRDGAGTGLQVSLARSSAFEARVAEVLAGRGTPATGPVLAFYVLAKQPGEFRGNLTFVQGHLAYHPDPQDTSQFGLVEGNLGPLAAGDRVLGYAVLPAHADPTQPIDVYWNDRLMTATFNP